MMEEESESGSTTDTSTHEDTQTSENTNKGESSCPKQKRTRGPTKLRKLHGKGPFKLAWDNAGCPVGEFASSFASYCGKKVRSQVNINLADWDKDVDVTLKNLLWTVISKKFLIHEKHKATVLSSCGSKWRDFKGKLTRRYIRNKHPKYDSPADCYSFIEPADWEKFKKNRETPESKEKSRKASENRSHNKHPHLMGRRGYNQRVAEWVAEVIASSSSTKPVGELVLNRSWRWIHARTKPDGNVPNENTQKVADDMVEWNKKVASGEFVPNRHDDVLSRSLGTKEHPGRVRGFSVGVTIKDVFGSSHRTSQKPKGLDDPEVAEITQRIKKESQESIKSCVRQELIGILKRLGMEVPDDFDFDEYQGSCPSQSMDSLKDINTSEEAHVTPNPNELTDSLSRSPSAKRQRTGKTSKVSTVQPTSAPDPKDLKEATKCRLNCVLDGVISHVADGTVYPKADETELVHGTPLLVGNMRVSIDKVLEGSAPLPVPTQFLERVADAAGSFVQWPKELIVIGDEDSLYRSPLATRKKKRKTSKGKSVQPTSAPDPNKELKEPMKCRLTCIHDEMIFHVAEATMYPNEDDDNELVNSMPLLVGNVKVLIDKALEGSAPLPIPTKFHERVGDAVGSFVQWPTELIIVANEDTQFFSPSTANKEQQTSKGSTVKPTSETKTRSEPNAKIWTIGPECNKLQDLLPLMSPEAKMFDVLLPSELFCFKMDKTIFITEEDIDQLLRMAFLNVSCIQLFMLYLQKQLEETNKDASSSIGFLCPTIISQIAVGKESNKEVMQYVQDSLLAMKNVGFVLVPFCQENHWMLIIICPLMQEAFFCDPMSSKRRDIHFKFVLQGAFRGFKARAGYTLKSGMSLKWSNLECHQQPGSTECGYYVMRYMLDIVRHYRRRVADYKKWFGSKKAYTIEEMNEVRDLWATYLMTNHL